MTMSDHDWTCPECGQREFTVYYELPVYFRPYAVNHEHRWFIEPEHMPVEITKVNLNTLVVCDDCHESFRLRQIMVRKGSEQ